MFHKIMVPVDLAHAESLGKAMAVAAGLARTHGASLTIVGVTTAQPSGVAHTPQEFERKLAAFAAEQAGALGVEIGHIVRLSHDPAIDKDDLLEEVVEGEGFDLVVMASHVPGIAEHVFASNAGSLAAHSRASVFVVRG